MVLSRIHSDEQGNEKPEAKKPKVVLKDEKKEPKSTKVLEDRKFKFGQFKTHDPRDKKAGEDINRKKFAPRVKTNLNQHAVISRNLAQPLTASTPKTA